MESSSEDWSKYTTQEVADQFRVSHGLALRCLRELGITPRNNRHLDAFTAEESQFVHDHVGIMTYKQIGEHIGRSISSVQAHARRKGWLG